MLFYISIFAFAALLVMLIYRYRAAIIPRLPDRVKAAFPRLSHYRPLATFSDQMSVGLTSTTFDIEANIREDDSREGLDEQGVQEVLEIMRRERVNFDQARLIRHNHILTSNGVDPSGMPMDSKAVTRL